MRTRLFLRTAEFLWQEGHTAHATQQEAIEEAERMLGVYTDFAEKFMSMPVIKGTKTANERFAGAIETYCIEALMQDGKALQAGTSHFLGQNFAKAFDVTFLTKEGKPEHVWATSPRVLLQGLMERTRYGVTLSDDEGLILPPLLAPIQVVIVPIYREESQLTKINETVKGIKDALEQLGIRVKYDNDDKHSPGWKFAEYELKGVPVRIGIGPKDLENGTIEVVRRDTRQKQIMPITEAVGFVKNLMEEIQQNLYKKALEFRSSNTHQANSYTEFKEILEKKSGFILAHWDGTSETEEKIKEETKATIRCIPLNNIKEEGKCIYSGKPSSQRVIFAKAY